MILAIDPGSIESAYVVLDENLKPLEFAKVKNETLLYDLPGLVCQYKLKHLAIEMIASYGMAVGKDVFDTCIWIGRFIENTRFQLKQTYIYRKDEKMNLCGTMKAKDTNIRMALIDRFAKHDFKNGKGTKKDPDIFYGFAKDVWSAMAVGVTYYDMYLGGENNVKNGEKKS